MPAACAAQAGKQHPGRLVRCTQHVTCRLGAYWLGVSPRTFYQLYTVASVLLFTARFITYHRKKWHYYFLVRCCSLRALPWLTQLCMTRWLQLGAYSEACGWCAGPLLCGQHLPAGAPVVPAQQHLHAQGVHSCSR